MVYDFLVGGRSQDFLTMLLGYYLTKTFSLINLKGK